MRLRTRTLRSTTICDLTGLNGNQFGLLCVTLWSRRPDRRRGRPWGLPFCDRVLLVTLALRTNLTERQLAALFDVSQSQVDRTVRDLTPHLAALLGPAPTDRRELWVVDGTLVPVRDHTRSAISKNYRRSANVQVVCRRRDRKVVAVGTGWPGNRNDPVVYRATVGQDPAVTGHRRLIGDGGYQGVDGVGVPRREHGRIVRDRNWRRFRKRRAVAEHTLANLKVWAVLRDCRRGGHRCSTTSPGPSRCSTTSASTTPPDTDRPATRRMTGPNELRVNA
jgi:hypothetical protein